MRRFRRLFVLLFISATFISALHELIHNHNHEFGPHFEEECPLYLMAHTPALLNDSTLSTPVDKIFIFFSSVEPAHIAIDFIPSNSRSPPLFLHFIL